MATRGVPGARGVSVKEVREFLKLAWVRDEELSDRGTDARLLPDGRVLLYWGEGEKGTLYPSRESFAQVRREGAEMMAKGRKVDLTRTLLPPVADFLRDVEQHAKSVGKRLRVPDEALDRTEASLEAVDKALRRIPWAKRMVPDLVTALVAYVGLVMLPVCGGRWATLRNGNEPLIMARDGRLLEPFGLVVIPMVEPSKRLPLRAAVEVTLITYRPSYQPGRPGTLLNPIARPMPPLGSPDPKETS
jgi:hypothetical protein